jgi:hypothetical protein
VAYKPHNLSYVDRTESNVVKDEENENYRKFYV